MGVCQKDPIGDIFSPGIFPPQSFVDLVVLNSQIRSSIDNIGLVIPQVQYGERGNEAGEARIYPGFPAVWTVTSDLRDPSILSRSKNFDQDIRSGVVLI